MSGRRGFTVVEVVIVLAILGLTAAAVAPAFREAASRPADPLAAAANDVAQLLRRARSTALERGASVSVAVSGAAGGRVRRIGADAASLRAVVTIDSAGVARIAARDFVVMPAGASFAALSAPVIGFAADGRSSGGAWTISAGARTATIAVDRWTGDVRVEAP